jgi:hypothetical protein
VGFKEGINMIKELIFRADGDWYTLNGSGGLDDFICGRFVKKFLSKCPRTIKLSFSDVRPRKKGWRRVSVIEGRVKVSRAYFRTTYKQRAWLLDARLGDVFWVKATKA